MLRTKRAIVFTLGVAVLATSPAFAADPPVKAKDDPSKRVCKVITPSGTRFSRRVCKSAEDWQHDEDFAAGRIDENAKSMRDPYTPGYPQPQ